MLNHNEYLNYTIPTNWCAEEGEYPFLHSGRNDTPKEFYHYTTDGYLFTFRYNENNVVYDIECELI